MPLDQVLQTLQHLPAPFISTFILIHLSAPVLANAGGSQVASQVMVSKGFICPGEVGVVLLVLELNLFGSFLGENTIKRLSGNHICYLLLSEST